MSVALAGREDLTPAALPRGAVAFVVALAVVLHLAGGAAVYWAAQTDGTEAAGEGGLTVGLGPSGAAPGAPDAVAAEPVETATPEAARAVEANDATEEVGPPPAPAETPETVPDAEAPAASAADAPPQPAPADSVDLAESVDPVVAPSMTPSMSDEITAQPDVSAETVPDTAPEAAAPETVTATDPQEGLGVSRRPATRPQSVEEAGRQAAEEAAARAEAARQQRRAAEAERDTEEPATERRAPAGQQGQSGASQGGTRGSGDGTEGGGNPGARADFAAIIAARLARAKQYPRSAQRARIEGTGTIWFRMNAAGQVVASSLTRGTGHAVLDQAIMETLRRARLPRIPDSVGRAQMEFSVPMSFTLR